MLSLVDLQMAVCLFLAVIFRFLVRINLHMAVLYFSLPLGRFHDWPSYQFRDGIFFFLASDRVRAYFLCSLFFGSIN